MVSMSLCNVSCEFNTEGRDALVFETLNGFSLSRSTRGFEENAGSFEGLAVDARRRGLFSLPTGG